MPNGTDSGAEHEIWCVDDAKGVCPEAYIHCSELPSVPQICSAVCRPGMSGECRQMVTGNIVCREREADGSCSYGLTNCNQTLTTITTVTTASLDPNLPEICYEKCPGGMGGCRWRVFNNLRCDHTDRMSCEAMGKTSCDLAPTTNTAYSSRVTTTLPDICSRELCLGEGGPCRSLLLNNVFCEPEIAFETCAFASHTFCPPPGYYQATTTSTTVSVNSTSVAPLVCGSNMFACHDKSQCIKLKDVCDDHLDPDCNDGSDELGCTESTRLPPCVHDTTTTASKTKTPSTETPSLPASSPLHATSSTSPKSLSACMIENELDCREHNDCTWRDSCRNTRCLAFDYDQTGCDTFGGCTYNPFTFACESTSAVPTQSTSLTTTQTSTPTTEYCSTAENVVVQWSPNTTTTDLTVSQGSCVLFDDGEQRKFDPAPWAPDETPKRFSAEVGHEYAFTLPGKYIASLSTDENKTLIITVIATTTVETVTPTSIPTTSTSTADYCRDARILHNIIWSSPLLETRIDIVAGDCVRFVWDTREFHSVTAKEGPWKEGSPATLSVHSGYTHAFLKPGIYLAGCTYYESMELTVRVASSTAASSTMLSTTLPEATTKKQSTTESSAAAASSKLITTSVTSTASSTAFALPSSSTVKTRTTTTLKAHVSSEDISSTTLTDVSTYEPITHNLAWSTLPQDIHKASITINIGDTVRWTYTGAHNIASGVGGDWLEPFSTPILFQGYHQIKFTRVGSFPYLCVVHPAMFGTITVIDPQTLLTTATTQPGSNICKMPCRFGSGDCRVTGPDGISCSFASGEGKCDLVTATFCASGSSSTSTTSTGIIGGICEAYAKVCSPGGSTTCPECPSSATSQPCQTESSTRSPIVTQTTPETTTTQNASPTTTRSTSVYLTTAKSDSQPNPITVTPPTSTNSGMLSAGEAAAAAGGGVLAIVTLVISYLLWRRRFKQKRLAELRYSATSSAEHSSIANGEFGDEGTFFGLPSDQPFKLSVGVGDFITSTSNAHTSATCGEKNTSMGGGVPTFNTANTEGKNTQPGASHEVHTYTLFDKYLIESAAVPLAKSINTVLFRCWTTGEVQSRSPEHVVKLFKRRSDWELALVNHDICSTERQDERIDHPYPATVIQATSCALLVNPGDVAKQPVGAASLEMHVVEGSEGLSNYERELMEEFPFAILLPNGGSTIKAMISDPLCPFSALTVVRTVGKRLASCLNRLHHLDIAHMDVCPKHIVQNQVGAVMLIDLGSANTDRTSNAYTEPETFSRTNASQTHAVEKGNFKSSVTPQRRTSKRSEKNPGTGAQCDMWAFGCTLYEIASGGIPLFDNIRGTVSPAAAARIEGWHGLSVDNIELIQKAYGAVESSALIDLLYWALGQDPRGRPPDMEAILGHKFFSPGGKVRHADAVARIKSRMANVLSGKRTHANVVVSYSWADTDIVLKISEELSHCCEGLVFDRLGSSGNACGWTAEMADKAIRETDVVLAIVSPEFTKSRQCGAEMAIANAYSKPVVSVTHRLNAKRYPPQLVGDTIITTQFGTRASTDLTDDATFALRMKTILLPLLLKENVRNLPVDVRKQPETLRVRGLGKAIANSIGSMNGSNITGRLGRQTSDEDDTFNGYLETAPAVSIPGEVQDVFPTPRPRPVHVRSTDKLGNRDGSEKAYFDVSKLVDVSDSPILQSHPPRSRAPRRTSGDIPKRPGSTFSTGGFGRQLSESWM